MYPIFGYVPFFSYLMVTNIRSMLPIQSTLPFSDYSLLYDLLVLKTNLLRQINDLVDFSFIRKELLAQYCSDNGRMAECPIRMFKYLLLKIIYDLSDVDVVEHSLYDLPFKYFLGMASRRDFFNQSQFLM